MSNKASHSITEWIMQVRSLEESNDARYSSYFDQELTKFERLQRLHELMGLPIHEYFSFESSDFIEDSNNLEEFFSTHNSSGKYSIRAEPMGPFGDRLPTQRKHGISMAECYQFVKQLKDRERYGIRLWEWEEPLYSGIMVVNDHGIFIEIVEGIHMQLSQGWVQDRQKFFHALLRFPPGHEFEYSSGEPLIRKVAALAAAAVEMHSMSVPQDLSVAYGFLKGFYDFMYYRTQGIRFNDHNTSEFMLKLPIDGIHLDHSKNAINEKLFGLPASPGVASGRARIIEASKAASEVLNGEILVATMTTPEFAPAMYRSAGIITDNGGVLCHAAIISRELGKPCIVGTGIATRFFKNGDLVSIDGATGTATRIRMSSESVD